MANDDETAPIDDDGLEQIRAAAAKQQHSGDDKADSPGQRRRPRKRANPPVPRTFVEQTNPISPPVLPTESPVAEAAPESVSAEPARISEAADAAGPLASPVDHGSTAEPLAPAAGIARTEPASAAPVEAARADSGHWQPGSRLSARVNPNPAPVRRKSSDRGLIVAAVILVVALLVAIGLYLVANAVVSDDGLPVDGQETEQSE